jgi:hypothetical protein
VLIRDVFLNCTLYIYSSKAAACKGVGGGTGFLVGVPLENKGWVQIYAVTNAHVIAPYPNPVIRFNTQDEDWDTLSTKHCEWVEYSAVDDLAVYSVDFVPEAKFTFIPIEEFVPQNNLLGPGDEVFMVGRFVTHEGKQKNTPAVRFGNIAMLPGEPIVSDTGVAQESFLIECRSIPGYSGSPVFAWIDPAKPRPPLWLTPVHQNFKKDRHGPWLLGVDWCHLNTLEKVLEADQKTEADPKRWVKSNTGMAGVIPAWRLLNLLNREELMAQRKQSDQEITDRKANSTVSLDSEVSRDQPIFTKEEFESALKKVSRKKE